MKHAAPRADASTTDHPTGPTPTHQRGDIQGLRAVAVGTVILAHAGIDRFAGGYVGVDVFFVISGFLITGILAREVGRTGRVSVIDFYARRARRILPAASVVLVGVTLASWAAFGFIRISEVLHDIVWAALFGANIRFATGSTDYFAQDSFQSPVQHFWSLAVEEQFYLLWPALIAIVALVVRRRVIRSVTVALLLICIASFVWSVHQTAAVPTSAYFSTFTRAWELGAGALLALGARYVQHLTRGFLTLLSWVGVALIVWSTLTFTDATPFPGSAALVPVVGAVLVLAGGMKPTPRGASLVLDLAPMRWMGDISYSLYLVHWPVLTIPAMAAGHELGRPARVGLIALAFVLAWLSFRFVETPFRSATFWSRSRGRALALWPAAVAVVLASTFLVSTQTGTASASKVVFDPQQSGRTTDIELAVQHAAARAKAEDPLPDALTPSPLKLLDANWKLPSNCWAETAGTKHDVCTFGDEDADRSLVLLGDSHIGVWTAPIVDLAEKHGWKVYLFLKTGCPPLDATMWRTERSNVYTECDDYRTWAYDRIEKIKPDRIIMSGYLQSRLADTAKDTILADDLGPAGTRVMAAGMKTSLATLTAITPDVTVIGDTTKLRRFAADCLGRKNATLKTCARPVSRATAARDAAWKQATEDAGGTWIGVTKWICADNVCPLVVGNVIVYTDDHHLTRTYAKALEPLLEKSLKL